MSAAGGTSADIEYDSTNINEKKNFKSMVEEFMQMQYDAGNISGYLFYKQFYDYMDGTDSKKDYSKFLEQYAEQIKEKIKNGETEPTYQIGGQSFTEEEWKKLVEKIDKDIEQIVRRRITIGCKSKLNFRLTPIRPRGLACNCTFLSA